LKGKGWTREYQWVLSLYNGVTVGINGKTHKIKDELQSCPCRKAIQSGVCPMS